VPRRVIILGVLVLFGCAAGAAAFWQEFGADVVHHSGSFLPKVLTLVIGALLAASLLAGRRNF